MDFQIIQGWEAKKGIVKFIKNNDLKLRKNIQERINFADSITETEYKRSAKNRDIFKHSIDSLIEDDCVAIFPTTPMPALNKGKINQELTLFRKNSQFYLYCRFNRKASNFVAFFLVTSSTFLEFQF